MAHLSARLHGASNQPYTLRVQLLFTALPVGRHCLSGLVHVGIVLTSLASGSAVCMYRKNQSFSICGFLCLQAAFTAGAEDRRRARDAVAKVRLGRPAPCIRMYEAMTSCVFKLRACTDCCWKHPLTAQLSKLIRALSASCNMNAKIGRHGN